jgi:hypothetical protein
MTVREQWDGGEWQEHCRGLLGARYGENIQFVPDRAGGDGGLEAYRLDCGTVYQCYAPEAAFSIRAQTDAQKRKIRDDIHKLVSKPEDTLNLLGKGYLISRWVLLTPDYEDKELIKYVRQKSLNTRSGVPQPPWCHEEFEIVVASDIDLFAVEMAQLIGPTNVIRLNLPDITEDAYASVDDGVAARLTEKLLVCHALRADEEDLTGYRSEILVDYAYGKRQLAVLEDRYSAAFSTIDRRARGTLRRLTHHLAAGSGDVAGLGALAKELSANFAKDVPALVPIACEDLAHYYMAEWWISCPLRFRAAG